MRHLRIPGQNIRNLSPYQSQLSRFIIHKKRLKRLARDASSQASTSKTPDDENKAGPSSSPKRSPKTRQRKSGIAKPIERAGKRKIKYPIDPSNNQSLVKKRLFKCTVCGVTESYRTNMLMHLETHTGMPISCLKCKTTFNGSVSYNWHLVHYCPWKTLKEFKFKCEQCPREFITRRSLLAHIEGHNRNNCTYCDKVITKRINLVKHLHEVHQIKLERQTFKCELCEKSYINRRNLFIHLKQHFDGKFVCLDCGKIEENKEGFLAHKKSHDERKKFGCAKCGDRFSRRQQYLIHLQRHDRYKCITCNETYASKNKIMEHKQEGHQVEGLEPKFSCPYCPAAFYRKGKLSLHVRKHTAHVRTFYCKYCQKTFSSPYAYYKHCITLNHEKFSPEVCDNVRCEFCQKRFFKRRDLKQHLYNVHNAKKEKHACQHCDYVTPHKHNMDRHVGVHFTKKRQFTCERCGKSCDSLACLEDHISYMHRQFKQFKCDKCGISFKRNSELVRHAQAHSDEKPHACSLCNKSYKRATHLKRHQKAAHQMKSENPRKIKRLLSEDREEPEEESLDTAEAPEKSPQNESGADQPEEPLELLNKKKLEKPRQEYLQPQYQPIFAANTGDVIILQPQQITSNMPVGNLNRSDKIEILQLQNSVLSTTLPHTLFLSTSPVTAATGLVTSPNIVIGTGSLDEKLPSLMQDSALSTTIPQSFFLNKSPGNAGTNLVRSPAGNSQTRTASVLQDSALSTTIPQSLFLNTGPGNVGTGLIRSPTRNSQAQTAFQLQDSVLPAPAAHPIVCPNSANLNLKSKPQIVYRLQDSVLSTTAPHPIIVSTSSATSNTKSKSQTVYRLQRSPLSTNIPGMVSSQSTSANNFVVTAANFKSIARKPESRKQITVLSTTIIPPVLTAANSVPGANNLARSHPVGVANKSEGILLQDSALSTNTPHHSVSVNLSSVTNCHVTNAVRNPHLAGTGAFEAKSFGKGDFSLQDSVLSTVIPHGTSSNVNNLAKIPSVRASDKLCGTNPTEFHRSQDSVLSTGSTSSHHQHALSTGSTISVAHCTPGSNSASSFLPVDKDWTCNLDENEAVFKVYKDVALNYSTRQLPVITESVIESSLPRNESSNSSL